MPDLRGLFLQKFLAISAGTGTSPRRAGSLRWWDFLFYASFGVMITKAVEISGILLVFSFLVIPAVISSLFLRGLGRRLAAGWLIGTAASITGLVVSYAYDFSAGPAIVSSLTLFLVATGCIRHVARSRHPVRSAIKLVFAFSSLVFLLDLIYRGSPLGRGIDFANVHSMHSAREPAGHGHPETPHALQLLDRFDSDPQDKKTLEELVSHIGGLVELLGDESPDVRERAAVAIGAVGGGPLVERELGKAFALESDTWVRFEIAKALLSLDPAAAGRLLFSMMEDEKTPTFLKAQAVELLRKETGDDFGYNPQAATQENHEALGRWRDRLEKPFEKKK